ncbi:hypothetical protein RFI_15024 [Reticulomyxa filosa]|uniref:Uncharacterized protein n=1 Tax=Reticulomyxa filosa TaxID=46433 RepID=X6N7Y3_RETFI|nr:hypothetical protein RFI_15024 [Reticulomyxa filosa]|eukprot:ETO22176.1 hypothetical protein RFI_15024 [Reticulomyxa filosa]
MKIHTKKYTIPATIVPVRNNIANGGNQNKLNNQKKDSNKPQKNQLCNSTTKTKSPQKEKVKYDLVDNEVANANRYLALRKLWTAVFASETHKNVRKEDIEKLAINGVEPLLIRDSALLNDMPLNHRLGLIRAILDDNIFVTPNFIFHLFLAVCTYDFTKKL